MVRIGGRSSRPSGGRSAVFRLPILTGLVALASCATPHTPSVPTAPAASPPAGMQYLYGSGEAAALGAQGFSTLVRFVEAVRGKPSSVVLAAGAQPASATFTDCGARPLAVVFDMDETLVLNLGYERLEALSGKGFDAKRWERWEMADPATLAPVPGAVDAVAALRRMGITPVVNTNRAAASAQAAETALTALGLGSFRHGDTLFLAGDVDGLRGKDGRRQAIAGRFCVVAMMGDQLGDFSDGFAGSPAARRALATAPTVARLWGNGWFVLPNPVYGAGFGGDWDQVFPADKHWVDPGEQDR